MKNDPWVELQAELDRWQEAGKTARFWLRDDDAIEPTPQLERFLVLAECSLAYQPFYLAFALKNPYRHQHHHPP